MSNQLSAAEHLTVSATYLAIAAQHQKEAARYIQGGDVAKFRHHEQIAKDNVAAAAVSSLAARTSLASSGADVARLT